jgi:UDPglucose 6-dehydrogenase
MKISVIGTGYVGLVTGTCLAEYGNDVTCVDIDADRVAKMQGGEVPFYEPDLETLFKRNIKEKRLHFSTDYEDAIGAAAIFLCLPTPENGDGSADLNYVLKAAAKIGPLLTGYTVIVNKSTVPVGTTQLVSREISKHTNVEFDVVSNPEFLREGMAVGDFMKPDKIVVGADSDKAKKVMRRLYGPFVKDNKDKLLMTDPATAETIKYAQNAFLATKISFMNGLTPFCENVGANIEDVRLAMGMDSRIGRQFLYPSLGWGGSCFPKDTKALVHMVEARGYQLPIVAAAVEVNETQQQRFVGGIEDYFDNDITERTFAVWGLAFKPETDDVRESPALKVVQGLAERGAKIVAFDPVATENAKKYFAGTGLEDSVEYGEDEYEILEGADALVIATDWKSFKAADFAKIKKQLKNPVIFDGRNLFDPEDMREEGFYYQSLGRPIVTNG